MDISAMRTFGRIKAERRPEGLCQNIDRRHFLIGLGAIAAFGSQVIGRTKGGDVAVVRGVRFDDALKSTEMLQRVIIGSIARLLGINHIERAAEKLFPADHKYSIKIDCASPLARTNSALIEAMLNILFDRAVQPWEVAVWDARIADIRQAGYHIRTRHGICEITAARMGNIAQFESYVDPSFVVFHDKQSTGEAATEDARLTALVADGIHALINLPALYHHPVSGFSGALSSLALGSIENAGRFQNDIESYIAAITAAWNQTAFSGHVLTVMDVQNVVYEGGPVGLPGWTAEENALIVGFDPVAVDSAALQIIERIRAEKGLSPIAEEGTAVLKAAEKAGIGSASPEILFLNEEQL